MNCQWTVKLKNGKYRTQPVAWFEGHLISDDDPIRISEDQDTYDGNGTLQERWRGISLADDEEKIIDYYDDATYPPDEDDDHDEEY